MIDYKLISPTGLVAKGQAKSICLPSTEGEMQLFPEHIASIIMLSPGKINITSSDNSVKNVEFFTPSGFASFKDNKLTVMGDEIKLWHDLTPSQKENMVNQTKQEITKITNSKNTEANNTDIDAQLTRLNKLLAVLNGQ